MRCTIPLSHQNHNCSLLHCPLRKKMKEFPVLEGLCPTICPAGVLGRPKPTPGPHLYMDFPAGMGTQEKEQGGSKKRWLMSYRIAFSLPQNHCQVVCLALFFLSVFHPWEHWNWCFSLLLLIPGSHQFLSLAPKLTQSCLYFLAQDKIHFTCLIHSHVSLSDCRQENTFFGTSC